MISYEDVIEVKFLTRSASYPKGELRSVCKVPNTQSEQESLPGDDAFAHASNLGAHQSLLCLHILESRYAKRENREVYLSVRQVEL